MFFRKKKTRKTASGRRKGTPVFEAVLNIGRLTIFVCFNKNIVEQMEKISYIRGEAIVLSTANLPGKSGTFFLYNFLPCPHTKVQQGDKRMALEY